MSASSSSPPQSDPPFFFAGFHFPNYTPVPDQVFDELLTVLTGAELKVLLYICRRTFGFKKESDNISLNQMLHGLVKKDGTRLDAGTGLSKPTLLKALRDLQEKGIIETTRRASGKYGDEATNYCLRFAEGDHPPGIPNSQHRGEGRSKNFTTGGQKTLPRGRSKKLSTPVVKKVTPQETVVQETVVQETEKATRDDRNNNSSDPPAQSDVVVALTQQGLSQKVAERLASHYNKEHIAEKLAYLDFLHAERPTTVANPRGWLRKAIEEDYGPPDGFLTTADRARRDAAHAEQAQRAEAVEQQQHAFTAQLQSQQEAFRRQLRERYGATEADEQLWQEVCVDCQHSQPHLHQLCTRAYVLACAEETVLLGFETETWLHQLEHPGTLAALKRALKRVAGRPLEVATLLLTAETRGDPEERSR